jgi:hypothetical protein
VDSKIAPPPSGFQYQQVTVEVLTVTTGFSVKKISLEINGLQS